MRNLHKMIFLFVTLVFISLYAGSFWRGTTLSPKEVKEKWGDLAFNSSQFKAGPALIKSKMAYRILTDKSLLGKSVQYVRETFGSPDGFYFIDIYPSYIIQEGQNAEEETWQIVFMLNKHFTVREIILHKNCCDK